ncbi:MAG: hypothetical protein ABEJ31_10360 [Haloarculaceae archaeon]
MIGPRSDGDSTTHRSARAAIAPRDSRVVLRELRERDGCASVVELADALGSAAPAGRADETTASPRVHARTRLHHVVLPRLERASLVDWTTSTGTVALQGGGLGDDPFARLLAAATDDWDAVLECLASERRRAVLAVLREREGPATVADLAAALAAREDETDAATDQLRVALVHRYLPKLAAAELIDRDDEGIRGCDHPALAGELAATLPERTDGGTDEGEASG